MQNLSMRTESLTRVVHFFEHLSPADIVRMGEIYAPDAYFKDPFNEVTGVANIAPIFGEMFESMYEPRFTFVTTVEQGNEAFLTWNMHFRVKKFKPNETMNIHGASHLRFDASGKITHHRDYWDAAEELYAKLPLIGALMRGLKRKLAHNHHE
jgi:steroid Delta-isomerase